MSQETSVESNEELCPECDPDDNPSVIYRVYAHIDSQMKVKQIECVCDNGHAFVETYDE